jgi:hypothetical protein
VSRFSGKSHNFPLKATIPHFRGVNDSGQGENQRFLQLRQRLNGDCAGDLMNYKMLTKQLDKIYIASEISI